VSAVSSLFVRGQHNETNDTNESMLSSLTPDIVVIMETFLDDSILSGELFPDSYTVFRHD